MKDFIMAALPFVICGIAIICLVMIKNKKESYIGEGMCLGMCFGSERGDVSFLFRIILKFRYAYRRNNWFAFF